MTQPRMTLCFTVHDKPVDVLERTFDALKADMEGIDDVAIVLDRSPKHVVEVVEKYWNKCAVIERIGGGPGWRTPVLAFNTLFSMVESEGIYCVSPDVVVEKGSAKRARGLLARGPAVIFGKCEDSVECNVPDAADKEYVSSVKRRPYGFIWTFPKWAFRAVDGLDGSFALGRNYEDDDFMWRLWNIGLPFVFDDTIRGVHQHHKRENLSDEMEAINRRVMTAKWGSHLPWYDCPKSVEFSDGMAVVTQKIATAGLGSLWGTDDPVALDRRVVKDEREHIFVAIPTMGWTTSAIAGTLPQFEKASYHPDSKYRFSYEVIDGARPADFARNHLVKKFLATDATRLFFIDSDVIPASNLLELLRVNADIVAGLIPIWQGQPVLTSYNWDRRANKYVNVRGEENTVKFVDALATASMTIRREVFESAGMMLPKRYDDFDGTPKTLDDSDPPPYFREVRKPNGELAMTEDLDFCYRAKARGFSVAAHNGVISGHVKQLNLLNILSWAAGRFDELVSEMSAGSALSVSAQPKKTA